MLVFQNDTMEKLYSHAQAEYPRECCGILFGKRLGERRFVSSVVQTRNGADENWNTVQFLIHPLELARAEMSAERQGLELVGYGMKELGRIQGLHLIGTAPSKSSALSFVMDGISNDAVGQRLDQNGIAVRVGHHCAQPILKHYGLESVVRPTLALYNSFEDIDTLARVLRSI